MMDENRESEDASQEMLAPYLEAEAEMRAKKEKARGYQSVSRDETGDLPEGQASPLSDQEVRLAISQPPDLPERRRIKDAAYSLKRSYPELSALRVQEDWERAYELVENDYDSGQFLIDRLGANRYLEANISMTILVMRQKMIEDMQIESAAEFMLMDSALMAYYNTIHMQTMLGDLVIQVERELFQGETLSVTLKNKRGWEVEEFRVEAMLNRASDKLLNNIDRANQMMIRNIKALRDLKTGTLSIRTEQVNIAQQQVNQVVKGNRKRGSRSLSHDPPEDSSTSS